MIILDRPYVSDFLKETIKRNNFPVLKTDLAIELLGGTDYNLIEAEEVIAKVRNNESPRVYTPSENTIHWISKNLDFTEMPEKISYFKNKVRFREMVSGMYPNFFFKEVALKDLAELDVNGFPFPFIIKPSVGFFSMGVYKVHNLEDWNGVLHRIENDMDEVKSLYPTEVMDANSFIIEEMIEGDEYAFDTYFNDKGEPVIVGILQHIFGSDSDVSDRVYFTSKEVIEKNLKRFTEFITKVGELAGLRNFPMHTEVRVTDKGEIIPIEVNPMRFGGWSTSADLTYHAFKINAIEYYLNSKKPNWNEIVKNINDNTYSIIILDNSTGIAGENIKSFDYDKLKSKFEIVHEVRKIDYKEYPVFGFLFAETRKENLAELDFIVKSDLKEFVTEK